MTVTEIATLKLAIWEIDENFKDVLKRGLDIQNDWHAAKFPHLPTTLIGRASHCLQQIEDPRTILITANWESVDAHWKWIRSLENGKVMGELRDYLISNPNDMVLLHVEGAIFGGETAGTSEGSTSLLDSPIICVERFFIGASKKEQFLRMVSVTKASIEKAAAPFVVRDSWRVDVKSKDLLECVLVTGWESVEKHTEFSQGSGSRCLAELKKIAQGVDTKHYQLLL
jgi:heme-degrading monooxygenase HmoA